MTRALAGRRVVVTRAGDQAAALAELLAEHGAVPIVVPLIEIVGEPAGVAELAELRPTDFDWLVVTSPNGAAAYARVHSTAPPQVAAVGVTTADTLAAAGIGVTLVPSRQSAAGLLAEFPPHPGRVLVIQAVDSEPTLVHGLGKLGAIVTASAPYRSQPVPPGPGSPGGQSVAPTGDAVVFASGSAARAWVAAFGTVTPPVVVAIGPRTRAAAEAVGLKVGLVAADHSLPGIVEALESHFSLQQ